MKKVIAVIALVSSMGAAYADEPVALTDKQMDNVSAGGGLAFTTAGAAAIGRSVAATRTTGISTVVALGPRYTLAISGSTSQSIGF